MIGTSCRFCEFSVIDENGNQIGCETNTLNKYQEMGVEVRTVDNDDEYGKNSNYELKTFCLMRRPPGWKNAKKEEGKSFEQIAKDELKTEITLLTFIRPGSSFLDVIKFVERVNMMTLKPNKIIFVNCAKISPLLFHRLNDISSVNWSMEFILKLDGTDDELRQRSYDLAYKKVKTSYFITLEITEELPLDYLEVIRYSIVDELQSFICILDEPNKPNFYQTLIFRSVRGNEQAHANDKIKWLAEDQECLHLIKTPKQIFNLQESL